MNWCNKQTTNKSHRCSIEQKKPDPKGIQCGFFSLKFNRQNESVVIEARKVATYGWRGRWRGMREASGFLTMFHILI